MKFLVPFLSLVLVSQFAAAATKHVRTVTIDDDSAPTSTVTVHQHYRESNSVVRDITPVVGLVLSDVTTSTSSSKTGFMVGADVDLFKFAADWTFETGLQYKQMGTSGPTTVTTLNYFVIPMAAKYYFQGEHATGFFGKAGFAPGINVAHSIADKQGNNSQDLTNINALDFGILFGVGGRIALSNSTSLLLEGDFIRGITAVTSDAGNSLNNTSFNFLSGVAINL
jgi:hypothetical protein